MVITMDEDTIEKIKSNLNELKEYAERFPENAGWRWAVESIDKTLVLFEPQEEKVDEGFDMPQLAEKKPEAEPKITEQMESDLIAGAVEEEEPTAASDVVPVDPTLKDKEYPAEE